MLVHMGKALVCFGMEATKACLCVPKVLVPEIRTTFVKWQLGGRQVCDTRHFILKQNIFPKKSSAKTGGIGT